MTRPRIFAELFAGSAALTLQLLGGSRMRPPVAYMGSKRGLAGVILDAVGLEPGQGAGSVLLCDGGPWGWVWQALAVPETCRAVAGVLRSWSDEDPTALWRRLAAEAPPADVVDRAATVLWLQGRAASNVPVWWEPAWEMRADDAKPYQAQQTHGAGPGRWIMPTAPRDGRANPGCYAATPKGVVQRGQWAHGSSVGIQSTVTVAARVDTIADAVARFLALQEGNHAGKPVGAGAKGWNTDGYAHLSHSARDRGFKERLRVDLVAGEVEGLADLPWTPITVVNADIDAALALLPADLDGCVVYLDPPYVGATRYACLCPREKVVAVAREVDRRGAVVLVSEAVPVEELGWEAFEITHAKRGQQDPRRKVKREWITMNRPPVRVPARQLALGAA